MNTQVFAGLLSDSTQLAKVMLGFETCIQASFAIDGAKITDAEIKRRFNICAQIFKQLRGDLSWGVTRILDKLPEYLRAELDGVQWEPDKRSCWIPSDGR